MTEDPLSANIRATLDRLHYTKLPKLDKPFAWHPSPANISWMIIDHDHMRVAGSISMEWLNYLSKAGVAEYVDAEMQVYLADGSVYG